MNGLEYQIDQLQVALSQLDAQRPLGDDAVSHLQLALAHTTALVRRAARWQREMALGSADSHAEGDSPLTAGGATHDADTDQPRSSWLANGDEDRAGERVSGRSGACVLSAPLKESIASIAAQLYVTPADIRRLNPQLSTLTDSEPLPPNTFLKLRYGPVRGAAADAGLAAPSDSHAESDVPSTASSRQSSRSATSVSQLRHHQQQGSLHSFGLPSPSTRPDSRPSSQPRYSEDPLRERSSYRNGSVGLNQVLSLESPLRESVESPYTYSASRYEPSPTNSMRPDRPPACAPMPAMVPALSNGYRFVPARSEERSDTGLAAGDGEGDEHEEEDDDSPSPESEPPPQPTPSAPTTPREAPRLAPDSVPESDEHEVELAEEVDSIKEEVMKAERIRKSLGGGEEEEGKPSTGLRSVSSVRGSTVGSEGGPTTTTTKHTTAAAAMGIDDNEEETTPRAPPAVAESPSPLTPPLDALKDEGEEEGGEAKVKETTSTAALFSDTPVRSGGGERAVQDTARTCVLSAAPAQRETRRRGERAALGEEEELGEEGEETTRGATPPSHSRLTPVAQAHHQPAAASVNDGAVTSPSATFPFEALTAPDTTEGTKPREDSTVPATASAAAGHHLTVSPPKKLVVPEVITHSGQTANNEHSGGGSGGGRREGSAGSSPSSSSSASTAASSFAVRSPPSASRLVRGSVEREASEPKDQPQQQHQSRVTTECAVDEPLALTGEGSHNGEGVRPPPRTSSSTAVKARVGDVVRSPETTEEAIVVGRDHCSCGDARGNSTETKPPAATEVKQAVASVTVATRIEQPEEETRTSSAGSASRNAAAATGATGSGSRSHSSRHPSHMRDSAGGDTTMVSSTSDEEQDAEVAVTGREEAAAAATPSKDAKDSSVANTTVPQRQDGVQRTTEVAAGSAATDGTDSATAASATASHSPQEHDATNNEVEGHRGESSQRDYGEDADSTASSEEEEEESEEEEEEEDTPTPGSSIPATLGFVISNRPPRIATTTTTTTNASAPSPPHQSGTPAQRESVIAKSPPSSSSAAAPNSGGGGDATASSSSALGESGGKSSSSKYLKYIQPNTSPLSSSEVEALRHSGEWRSVARLSSPVADAAAAGALPPLAPSSGQRPRQPSPTATPTKAITTTTITTQAEEADVADLPRTAVEAIDHRECDTEQPERTATAVAPTESSLQPPPPPPPPLPSAVSPAFSPVSPFSSSSSSSPSSPLSAPPPLREEGRQHHGGTVPIPERGGNAQTSDARAHSAGEGGSPAVALGGPGSPPRLSGSEGRKEEGEDRERGHSLSLPSLSDAPPPLPPAPLVVVAAPSSSSSSSATTSAAAKTSHTLPPPPGATSAAAVTADERSLEEARDDVVVDEELDYDTIAVIANTYNVSIADVLQWNPYLGAYDVNEPLPPDLPIVLPMPSTNATEAAAAGAIDGGEGGPDVLSASERVVTSASGGGRAVASSDITEEVETIEAEEDDE